MAAPSGEAQVADVVADCHFAAHLVLQSLHTAPVRNWKDKLDISVFLKSKPLSSEQAASSACTQEPISQRKRALYFMVQD